MDLKAASILGLLCCFVPVLTAHAVEKDWAAIVTSLAPKQGQNFEQDLQLAKALFSLERRPEAMAVLNEYEDPEAAKLARLISGQFYTQDSATLYYEALRLIALSKWSEAREKLESALTREAGNGLVLQRLIQVELVLAKKDSAAEHLKLAQELLPHSKELAFFAAKLALDTADYREAYRILSGVKSQVLLEQTLSVWWFETLLRLKKFSELQAIETRFLKDHRTWSYAIDWWIKSKQLSSKDEKVYHDQLGKNLADEVKFNQTQELEGKKTQFQWAGYYSFESLKPPPTAQP
jgi:hypothetical protein